MGIKLSDVVFFFLKDSKVILSWFSQYLPNKRGLLQRVWSDVNKKISVYVGARGEEAVIVSVVSTITFELLGLQYAVLLGFLVGVSVWIYESCSECTASIKNRRL